MLLRANPPEKVAPTGKPHSIGFARRSNAVTFKRQRKYFFFIANLGEPGRLPLDFAGVLRNPKGDQTLETDHSTQTPNG